MRVIGVVGQNGSGKDEVLKYLNTHYSVPFLSTGDIVREIAAKEGVAPTRTNLQAISDRYFRQFGRGYFVKLVAEKIRQNNWQIAGVSGIRAPEDVQALKNAFEKDFILIHVFVSDSRVRYARMRRRAAERDPQEYEQFLRQDKAEEELFSIQEAVRLADYSLSNDGTLEDLHREIDRLITEKNLLAT